MIKYMDCVYELVKCNYIKGLEINDSLSLFLNKEKATETKKYLEKYNPNEIYKIVYRRVE